MIFLADLLQLITIVLGSVYGPRDITEFFKDDLFYVQMFGVGDIINCLDVLEKTTDTRKTLQELSTVYSLQGFFCN